MPKPIPVNTPHFSDREKDLLLECIESGWISSEGPFVAEFEDRFSNRVDREHGIAVSSGSAALDIAVAALELGPGDEVILPTFTIISCASAILRAGARPLLVDADPETWNMRTDQVASAITDKTRAIMVVHIYGLPVDLDSILDVARDHDIYVIEDAAEAIGLAYKDKPCGSFGDISTFSFYPNKLVTTGEGGMVVTDNPEIAERCRSLRNLCFQPERRFVHEELGWNYRLTNLQAAVGLAQLDSLDASVTRKRGIGNAYNGFLGDIECIELPAKSSYGSENIYWVYGIVLKDDSCHKRETVTEKLAAEKIGTRPFFWPMHEQPVFKNRGLFESNSFPVAERLARNGFYLPSGLGLTDEEIVRVSKTLHEILL